MGFDFSAVAASYAAYRPHYPSALLDALGGGDIAWDAGCGSGQLSVALAERFARVIATDPSQAQIDAAERHPRVEYRRGAAEDGVDAVCDLSVAAQAAHWFDWPAFVDAVRRCTKVGGRAAVISYGRVVVPGDAGAVLDAFYDDVIASYWPPERAHVHDGYAKLNWPWPAIATPAIDMVEQWSRDELLGYLGTWSAVSRYLATKGTAIDALVERMSSTWPADERREIRWPLTVKIARRA